MPLNLGQEAAAFSPNLINQFGAQSFNAFLQFVNQNCPLLGDLLIEFKNAGFKIDVAQGQATGTDLSGDISISSALVPNINPPPLNGGVPLDPAIESSYGQFADVLAHEIGHALMPDGRPVLPGGLDAYAAANNPDDAILIGSKNEGSAIAVEFLVASQLRTNRIPPFTTPEGNTAESSDFLGGLGSSLTGALGSASPSSFTTLQSIKNDSTFVTAAESIGGGFSANLTPSANKRITYQTYWVASWFLDYKLPFFGAVTVTSLNTNNFTFTGNAASGWTFTGQNILMGDSANGALVTQPGWRLSFTASESGSTVNFGEMTLTNPFNVTSAGVHLTSSTLVGGVLPNEVYQGVAGIDVFEIPTGVGTSTIICNAGGLGNLTVNTLTAAAVFSTANARGSAANTWTDGSEQITFKSGAQMDSVPAGADLSGIAFSSTVGELVIKNFDGRTNQTVDLFGFDINQATHGGFLGINLKPRVSTSAVSASEGSTFVSGAIQQYDVSIDAPSTQTEMFTVTVTGVPASGLSVEVGTSVTSIGSNGTFNLTLAAGQTTAAFSLIDSSVNGGTANITAGETLTLSASLSDPYASGGQVQAAPLVLSYVAPSPDTSTPPAGGVSVSGSPAPNYFISYDDTSGNKVTVGGNTAPCTVYLAQQLPNVVLTAGAGPNWIDASGSSNDSITGGSGVNYIAGGSGNVVVNLVGSNDVVYLGGGFNTVNGGSGLDTIHGSGGGSIIVGNGGTDVILGGGGTNQIYAGAQTSLSNAIAQTQAASATNRSGDLVSVLDGTNTVVGGSGNDLITAGSGSDVVVLGSGNDTFYGGWDVTDAQTNWSASVVGSTLEISGVDGYAESFSNPFAQPYHGSSDPITGAPSGPANDTIFAGNGSDLIVLGNGNNFVQGGSGSESIFGGMGNDTVMAGSGNDYVAGGGGNTYIYGGAGADTLRGGDGNNTIIGGSGNSTIISAHGPAATYAGLSLEQNYVFGGSGNDLITGSAGNDTLIAGSGNTTIQGGSGNEYIIGGAGADSLVAGLGNTTLEAGGNGRDTLVGGANSAGSYLIYGGGGVDSIVGGSGFNLLYAGDGGTVGAATTVQAGQTGSTTIYGGAGIDLLVGGAGTNVIYGGDGTTSAATTLIAGGGTSTLYGGLGTDLILGGSGTDVLYAGGAAGNGSPTSVIAGTGIATLYGGSSAALLQDLQSGSDLIVSQNAADTLIGVGNDTLVAGSGGDIMQANGGSVAFEFNPGSGNATISASGGQENLVFGVGITSADLFATVQVDSNGSPSLELEYGSGVIDIQGAFTGGLASVRFLDPAEPSVGALLSGVIGSDQVVPVGTSNLILSLGANESVSAGANNDTLSSWGNNNTLLGGTTTSNADLIYSAGDSASIVGGMGVDSLEAMGDYSSVTGGANGNYVTLGGAGSLFTGTTGPDVITASGTQDTIVAGSGNSEFLVNDSTAVIQVAAGTGVDSIVSSVSYTAPTNVNVLTLTGSANIAATGNAGTDLLIGGAGNETLIAGAGTDTLQGGAGNTTFVVNSTGDVVRDSFTSTSNQILSSVSYVLPANVNTLTLTGTDNLTATANSGNDTLVSNSGIDTLIGGSGNDTFVVSNPGDVIEAGSGTTTIIFESSAGYTLPAGAYSLTLTGTGNAVATAGSGNDTLISNSGVDTLYGGAGNDTFVIQNGADVVVDTSTTANNVAESSVSYSLPGNVNTLILTGSAAITGTGNSGNDLLQANAGNATLISGTGVATLVGGTGNDVFVVNNSNDVVQDTVVGTSDTLLASVSASLAANVDTLMFTGTANVSATANADNDTLISNSGVDTFVGGTGDETYIINNSSDVVQDHAADLASTVESSVSYTLPNFVTTLVLTGTNALTGLANQDTDDLLQANSGSDLLIGGAGYDTLVSGTGIDTLQGGSGVAVFVVNNTADVVEGSGVDSIISSVSFVLPTTVNTLILTGTANLAGSAVSGNNSIVGNAGSDTLTAGSGRDTLVAGSGVATLVGGAGADTFIIDSSADVIQSVSGAAGNQVLSSVSYSLPTSINILTLTGLGNLLAVGNANSDSITANSGNDTLIAGTGIATLVGGLGSDLFVVNNSADVVSNPDFGISGGQDTVQSSVSFSLAAGVNILQLTGTGNLVGTGNAGGDSIVGNAGNDTLVAGSGNTTLVAGSGLATLIGSVGNDTFVVNNVNDVLQDSAAGSNNAVLSSVSYTLPTDVNTLVLTGTASLVGTGNSADDSMVGNAGADTLIAGGGNDTLVAGAGLDTFIAGSGNDTFRVNNSADVIEGASATSTNVVLSSSSFVLPTNVNVLIVTGAASMVGTGNAGNDTLTGAAGNDTLVAGTGLGTLIGGSGNTVFVVDATGDVVIDSYTTSMNEIQASVSYVLPTNVNTLILTGTDNLAGTANNGADTLISNNATDTLFGGTGVDTFVVNNSGDVVQASSAAAGSVIQSSVSYSLASGVNTLQFVGSSNLSGTANSGNDTLLSNSGVDTFFGGAGNDTFIVSNAADVVQDTSTSAHNTIVSSVSYSLPINVNVLTLTGTSDLVATGNGGSDVIQANSGNDTLVAGSGAATLVGGGSGNDLFVLNSTSDVVQVVNTGANDTLESSVSYTLPTTTGLLQLIGSGNLVAQANSGNDTLISNNGVDTLIAGAGSDLIIVNNSADVVQNVTAGDTIESSASFTLTVSGELTLLGTAAIMATGNATGDVLTAGSGNDTLVANAAHETLIGGSGNDTFVVSDPTDVVVDTAASTSNLVLSSVSYSLPQGVDALTLTGTGRETLTGNQDVANVLTANSADDTIVGTAYNNTLTGGAAVGSGGAGAIYAGPGTNLISTGNGAFEYVYGGSSLSGSYTQSTIYGGSGTDYIFGGPGTDLIYTGAGHETVTGGTGFETLYGSSGTNVLYGGSGTNLIYGGAGTTTIEGGSGSNVIYGGNGTTLIQGGSGTNAIYAGNGGTTLSPIEVEGDPIGTTATQNTIYGGSGVDHLRGGPGADALYAGTGIDTLYSGSGADSLYGASGDLLYDSSSGKSLLVAGAGAETLSGAGGDTLVAGTGADLMYNGAATTTGSRYEFDTGFGQDTIGNVASSQDTMASSWNDTLAFGAGITPNQLTLGIAWPGSYYNPYSLALVINDGTSSILVQGGVDPGVVTAVTFADGSSETLTQLMNAQGPGLQSVAPPASATTVLSTGDGATIADPDYRWANSDYAIFAFGNNDVITDPSFAAIFAYGNNDTVSGYQPAVWAGGNNDSITLTDGIATLAGANDTLITGAQDTNFNFVVYQSSDVIEATAGTNDSVDAFTNYVLPTNIAVLRLDSSVGGLSATSNAQGGILVAAGNYDTVTGGAGSDTLVGQGLYDVLIGGAGSETYILNSTTETIQFGTGAAALNTVEANFGYTLSGAANNLVEGGSSARGVANSANDLLTAVGTNDTLVAGAGNDTLVAASTVSGATLIGGTGNDTFVINRATDVIIDTVTGASNVLLSSVSYTLPVNVNALVLTDTANLVGTANGANDSLTANNSTDTLIAGSGNDTLVAGGGTDTFKFNAGFGQDQILDPQNGDTIQFGAGITQSNLTFSVIAAPAPALVISGAGGSITVQGGLIPGAIAAIDFGDGTSATIPQLVAPSGSSTLAGTSGNLILSSSNNASITGGGGSDTIIAWGSADTLAAGAGGSFIAAGGSGAQVFGGTGTDTLLAGASNDTLFGGTGNETFVVQNSTAVVQVSAGAAGNTLFSSASYTLPANIATLTLTGTAALQGTGNGGNDTLIANSGADTLVAGTGLATLIGGSGPDLFVVNNGADVVLPGSSAGVDTLQSSSSYSLPGTIDTLVLTGTGGLVGTANSQNDTLSDIGGSSSLVAGAGDDELIGANFSTLIGGSGSDVLATGLTGNHVTFITGSGVDTIYNDSTAGIADQIYINNPADVVTSISSEATLYTSVSYTLLPNLKEPFFNSSGFLWQLTGTASLMVDDEMTNEGVSFTGNSGNDTLIGGGQTEEDFLASNSYTVKDGNNLIEAEDLAYNDMSAGNGNNTMIGGADGNDTFNAGNGNNLFIGGARANNTFQAGTGADTFVGSTSGTDYFVVKSTAEVIEASAGAQDTLAAYISYTLPSAINIMALQTQGLVGVANSGNDTLSDYRADTLIAGSGNDSLVSWGGSNTIVAGAGADTIRPYDNTDLLLFNPGFGSAEVQRPYYAYAGPALDFAGGISAANITASPVIDPRGGGGLQLSIGGGSITLDGALAGSTSYQFEFNGGQSLTLPQLLSEVTVNSGTVAGASGNLVLQGLPGISITGGTGSDTIYASGSGDTITGGSGAQLLTAAGTDESVQAGSGSDSLTAYGDYDTLVSGSGSNVTYVYGNHDVVISGSAAGSAPAIYAYGIGDSLVGGTGNDILEIPGTSARQDTLVAGSGPQTLISANGAGTTTFVVNNTADVVREYSSGVSDTLESSVSFTLPQYVDTLIFTGTGSIRGTGNTDNDLLVGNSGQDTLTAGSGLDTLVSGSGIDSLVAGSGANLFVINNTADTVTVGSQHGVDTIEASVSYSLPSNANTLILSGSGTITGTGNTSADLLVGNLGIDTLTAAGTNATTLMGGGGSNTFVVVNTKDVVVESFTGTADLILSTVSYTLPTNVDVLTLSGTSALAATGNSQSDVLNANSGADTLTAGTGLATLNGGSGSDIFVVDNTGDVVNVTVSGVTDTIQSTVNYVLPANVIKLTLEGTQGLSAGTTNGLNDTLTANSGNDTLVAGTTGADSLVGGAGNDLFIIDNTADIVSVGASHGIDTIQSSVNVTAPANVASITLTGSAPLSATGSATQAGVLTAGSGNDTLTALDSLVGSGATLFGGAGNDVFSINNSADVISDTYTLTTNTLMSSVSYTLPTNVNILNVTGAAAVIEHGNSGNDSMTANNAADTLVAGNGTDTLVSGTGIDSLVGGTGTDLFVVKNAADIVTVASGGATNDTISSSVSFTLSPNVQYLTLTGTGTVSGTGNSLTDLIVGNTGTDTLTGGTGIAVLEGGTGTLAHDTLKAPSAQAALIAGGGTSTLTGGAFKDFYGAAGTSQSITTGATANVIAINKGDGATTFVPTTGASDVFSLGAGIDTESLTFTKSGTTGLILSDGVGDSITLTNWFTSTNNQDVKTLQVVEQASASYNASGTDALRNKPLEEFNFTALVTAFTNAGSPANWALSTDMPAAAITSSATAAYGGDLAYYFGLNGNLTGMNLSAAQSTLTNSSFATAAQTIDSWSSISGGGGLHLLVAQPPAFVDPIQMQWMNADASIGETSGLAGSEVESGPQHEAVPTLLAATPNIPPARRTIETPHAYMQ